MSMTIARLPHAGLVKRRTKFGSVFTLSFAGLLLGLGSAVAYSAETGNDSRVLPEIKWDTTLNKFQFDADKFIGQRLTVKCPPAAVDQSFSGVYGTDFYPSDTSICIAANAMASRRPACLRLAAACHLLMVPVRMRPTKFTWRTFHASIGTPSSPGVDLPTDGWSANASRFAARLPRVICDQESSTARILMTSPA